MPRIGFPIGGIGVIRG